MEIRKKCWPDLFEKVKSGKKNVDVRLADFDVKEGDTLILEEFDPKTRTYTGRKLTKHVRNVNKVHLLDFHTPEEIKEFGHWIIELS